MKEAEEMYQRALTGYEKASGPDHTSTLRAVHNLGVFYSDQGKMKEAEEMYLRALMGKEKAWGPDHTSTLDTVNNLGLLYHQQGNMEEAEKMYLRALQWKEEVWGSNHSSTLRTVDLLCQVYSSQARAAYVWEMRSRSRLSQEVIADQHESPARSLPKLVSLCHRFSIENKSFFGKVGRVLLWAGDDDNAQLAFQVQVTKVESIWSHGAVCDYCERSLTFDTKRLVCKACADVDLCEACYRKYETLNPAEFAVTDCTGHEFLAVQQPDCWQADSEERSRTWMSRMLQLCPIAYRKN
jgi:tetratricopeptide (TPR) repeat protein